MAVLPPATALRQLEPQPGGQWTITGQSQDGFSLSYLMSEENEAITYTMFSCTTEEEVQTHCGSFLYEFSTSHTAPFMQQNGIQSFDPSQTTSNSSLHLVLRPRTQPIATETNQDQPANVTNPQQIPSYGQSCETSLFERVSSNSYFGSESTALQNQVYSQEETTPVGNSQQQHTFLNDTAFNWSPASDGHLEMNPTAFSMINTMSNSGMESSQDTSHFPMMPWGEQWMPIADPSNGIGSDGGWYTLFSD